VSPAVRSPLAALIAVRIVASTLLLGSAVLVQLNRPGALPVDPFFFLIGLTYALSVVYTLTLRFASRWPWLAELQLAVDAVLVSAFVQITGGITSYFSSLYVLPIIAASAISHRRAALQVAFLSALLYLSLVAGQYVGVPLYAVPSWDLPAVTLPPIRVAQYMVAITLFGFFAVALLSGSLAERLRFAGVRLERASHQIADLRAFNDSIINSLLSGLVTIDGKCRILTFNRAAATITGVDQKDAVGRPAVDVLQLPDDFRSRLQAMDGQSLRIETEYRTADARVREVGLTATTLTLPDGSLGYLLTFQDVTTVRRLEQHARLQQRLAAVGEMAAGIAHEIRNPLASMSGSIQVLRQELPLNDEQAQLMDIVVRESDRLNETIRSFLAYARPQRFAVAPLDVGKIVHDMALLLRNSSDVSPSHTIAVDVPASPAWYEADENQLRQIIWNLATNGVRAMRDGGTLRLTVRRVPVDNGGELVLAVEDQGRGIPAAEIDSLFQPFHSTFEKGTGLGLAIVHRIVSDYGGVVGVSSSVGVGTVVTVRLPIRPVSWTPESAGVGAGASPS
jgi:two-component system sensor histidine kinase PilS (NtrC family)